MQTVGEPFDPMKHDALLEEPRDDVAAGLVTREIQRGYVAARYYSSPCKSVCVEGR